MNSPTPAPGGPELKDPHAATRDVDWQDFRDHLATADQKGYRRWIHPKKPHGIWYNRRTYVSWLLLGIMFVGPFVRINGNPLLMINIIERRFSILGQIFWPQDTLLSAVAMLVFFTGIIIFTTAYGRLWCGWTCPQTLLMEMVFRKIEYAIDGDSVAQRALAAAPWTASKILKRVGKQAIFFILSFIIGNVLLSYIIGSDQLIHIIRDDPRNHTAGLTFMVLFTLLFYAIFARFREQACTFICPYGRFMSAVLDENSMVVAYDYKRGEKRAPLSRTQNHEQRVAAGSGDCISCNQCVAVCPTGIDIRNGTQMECVNCTACIDACDNVMDKIGRPRGLVRYASLNTIEKGSKFRFTARMGMYAFVLTALICFWLLLVFTRKDIQTSLLRAPGALFQQTETGKVENLYLLKLINKTSRDIPVQLKLEGVPGELRVMGNPETIVPKEKLIQTSVLVEVDKRDLHGPNTQITIGVYEAGKRIEGVKTIFAGPRN